MKDVYKPDSFSEEEIEAACTRVIIIDRGKIVANGTPQELKARSELAGAVRLKTRGVTAATLNEKLSALGARISRVA